MDSTANLTLGRRYKEREWGRGRGRGWGRGSDKNPHTDEVGALQMEFIMAP
jgi:hypothetical protein